MFNNFTYKQKFFGVIIGFLILFLALYKKTFSKVIESRQKLSFIEEKSELLNESNYNIFNTKNEIKNLDDIIGGDNTNPQDVQQKILNFITKKELNNNLVSIEDVHLNSNNEFLIYTNQIMLDSNYESLIKILYDIEKQFIDSRVISAKLFSKKNTRTNKTKIYLKIILQNYEKK
jgi:hypothetical protein